MNSKEELLQHARQQDYKPEMLEKVYRLLDTLEQITQIPYLKDKVVLKGGTALNLFCFDDVPRLSVDIDINYIGQLDREAMLRERPLINEVFEKIRLQNQFEPYRNPNHHAGGKMVWRYPSALGQKGNLEIDLNYMYRQPLWVPQMLSPNLDYKKDFKFPVLDIHELAAGKLSALMSRDASRDLYDAHYLLTKCKLDNEKLRFAFVVYLAMTSLELSALSLDSIQSNESDIRNRLMPVLRQQVIPRARLELKAWVAIVTEELKLALNQVLPLRENEMTFISKIRNENMIDASVLTDDKHLQKIVASHPALQWAIRRNN